MTGAAPGLFDAVVQLYDGHGGKFAARHCVAHLVPRVTEAFFKQKACRAYRYDTASLVEATRDGFHPAFDAAVVTAFEQLDEEIKRLDPSGTTAAVLVETRERRSYSGRCHRGRPRSGPHSTPAVGSVRRSVRSRHKS